MRLDCFTSPNDEFDFLDLRAQFQFKTATSIGFRVGPIPQGQFSHFGYLQVHHPSVGEMKARVYVQLPRRYRDLGLLRQVCMAAFRALGIPDGESFELNYANSEEGIGAGRLEK
ncbi:MAG: hypothetical protein EB141_18915 [Verrucomicrobia bacterium]|nr:hypothetical protein [Verrucomicrobiota bacterium]NBU11646.1 hypothetical protein [Pseudomonadota bacterium]NDB77684.1 hypothetical protein [Verrucomicrobiota bacterium]NDD40575.1 hypothetical protein [Verrucomicrobiota bacterium]